MNPWQEAFDRLKVVAQELECAKRTLDERLAQPSCTGTDRHEVSETRANLERTFLLRLYAEFEGGLGVLGPNLRTPCVFAAKDGLGYKLDQIG